MGAKPPRLAVDMKQLTNVLQAFYTLTNVVSTLYNADFQEILTYPPHTEHCGFCKYIRTEFLDKCIESDRKAFQTCAKTGEVYAYCCHAGLYEVITPIKDKSGIIGYIMFGQAYNEDFDDLLKERLAEYGKYLDPDTLQQALSALKPLNSEIISAVTLLTKSFVTYVVNNRIVRVDKANFEETLVQYIEENLSGEITVSDLCHYFGISRTSFYELSSQCLNCSVMQYIKRIRIEKAKKLLADPSIPITKVAEQVGFWDYNYFIRVFKKETGISCKEFRQAAQ